MERRLAFPAGPSRHALRWCVALGVLVAGTPVVAAAPKSKGARAAFDRGVAAYQKGDYAGAAAALGASYELEQDIETLFAWAQAERQQDRCDNATELYNKLLAFELPDENRRVVETKLEECRAILAASDAVEARAEPAPGPEPAAPERAPDAGRTPWWKDPVGDTLTGVGVVGLGVGAYFLVSARRAEQRSLENHDVFLTEDDKAEAHGRIGVIAAGAGAVLVIAGIVRYMTRPVGGEGAMVSGWVTPEGGGIAAFATF